MFPTNRFKDKRIVIGITGGIAAYKITELVRYLVKQGAEVRVMMTEAGERFIPRLTMETLSQNPVAVEMFPEKVYHKTHHISLADWAEAIMIAPATYNFIGKLWAGIADDLLTTVCAAASCPVFIAPAMNVHMWENPILQRNIADLKKLGYLFCEPEEGFLAEGYSGKGRLARLEYLVQHLYRAIHPHRDELAGKKVVITAGRTEELIDPARMLTNPSSGKMGYALAWEACARGADVTLISGPASLTPPDEIKFVGIRTAAEMWQAVQTHFSGTDIYLSAAAIADYTPIKYSPDKRKKSPGDWQLSLKRTVDILKEVGKQRKPGQKIVGFAVETRNPREAARKKLNEKNLDLVVLNNPREEGAGFQQDTNKVTLISRQSEKELPLLPKLDVAFEIFEALKQIGSENA
ncbi:MAG: bifunctional phosphopantothenoylcysteine decarboxylase/phosphopantothenate--cysteine ligase CoaBC [Calditrichia bacterium]